MKISTLKLGAVTALAFALVTASPVTSFAQEKAATKQLELSNTKVGQPINTPTDLENVKAGDMIVMSCPKCKDVTVTTITKSGKGALGQTSTRVQHMCPGCATAIESVGHGKAKTNKIVHTCSKCGSEDAFCCVVKKSGGPNQGMGK